MLLGGLIQSTARFKDCRSIKGVSPFPSRPSGLAATQYSILMSDLATPGPCNRPSTIMSTLPTTIERLSEQMGQYALLAETFSAKIRNLPNVKPLYDAAVVE